MSADGGPKTKAKPAKMTLEEYLDFIESDKKKELKIDHLHQIVDMHGFKKIVKQPKSVLIEAVNSLELIDPSRSTVNDDGVSPDAILSLDDIINDLNELNWHECCITSLQTMNVLELHNNPSPGSTTDAASALTVTSELPTSRPKRRLKRLRDIFQESSALASGSGTDFGGTETTSSSPPSLGSTWMSTRKRSMKNINEGEIGPGGEEELDDGGKEAAADP